MMVGVVVVVDGVFTGWFGGRDGDDDLFCC